MLAAFYYNNKDIRIKEISIPEIGSEELLLKVIASGICGSDVIEWYRVPRAPIVLGHEAVGTIDKIGQKVKVLPGRTGTGIDGEVKTASGIAKTIEIVDSGFGYIQDEVITLSNDSNQFSITGTSNIINQGIGAGYWENTKGFLNSDKYIHDNKYYQSYSYEIQVGLSLDKYSDILKDILHVSGTTLFGRSTKESTANMNISLEDSSITQSNI